MQRIYVIPDHQRLSWKSALSGKTAGCWLPVSRRASFGRPHQGLFWAAYPCSSDDSGLLVLALHVPAQLPQCCAPDGPQILCSPQYSGLWTLLMKLSSLPPLDRSFREKAGECPAQRVPPRWSYTRHFMYELKSMIAELYTAAQPAVLFAAHICTHVCAHRSGSKRVHDHCQVTLEC